MNSLLTCISIIASVCSIGTFFWAVYQKVKWNIGILAIVALVGVGGTGFLAFKSPKNTVKCQICDIASSIDAVISVIIEDLKGDFDVNLESAKSHQRMIVAETDRAERYLASMREYNFAKNGAETYNQFVSNISELKRIAAQLSTAKTKGEFENIATKLEAERKDLRKLSNDQ